ncbi:hypothetical protein A3C87_04045 [Candidatus Kaiserbacteria bacterium RIFCSPHIGHO2_02_FULL_49_34]|uniref:Type II secretion system protein GspI C-terminal domain-containing protein n=1 Tax=Candidatus Kaiserbacteria bacterium RIFCSPHIGHO2_02_FULL_49_34 TaxID=1798491 RepID=A0A1F6DIR1_9BACT|nr:MAG: hypothetical protein A3C87_04045 [Candidatus Kaiserbacteria bacterium RIFCSPHIGHO2_02_FULL_49_34]
MTRSHQQGFTLVETLVAISVLIVAIVVPLRVITQSLKSAAFTREKITATHIAQEGIELMNAQYDEDKKDLNTAWSRWASVYGVTSGFSFEPRTKTLLTCTSTASNPCRIYTDANGYTHSTVGTTLTPYVRTLRVRTSSPASASAVEVESIVTWQNAFGSLSTSSRTVWYYNAYE